MRYPTLRRVNCVMELGTLFRANDDQDDTSDERQTARDGRNGNMLVLVRGGVDGADIQDFFLMGVGETLISEREAAENYQKNSNKNSGFHKDRNLTREPSLERL